MIWPYCSVHSHNTYHAMGPKESSPRSRLSEHVITPAVVLPGSRIDDLPPIVYLPADDPPRQCQHQVIPVVAVGGQPILSDCEELCSFFATCLRAAA